MDNKTYNKKIISSVSISKSSSSEYAAEKAFASARNVRRKKLHFNLPAVCAASGCIMLLISPSLSLKAAKDGLDLWINTVIPSLLPFFICTDMLIKTGVHEVIGKILKKPMKFLLGAEEEGGFVFISSIISGYPAGARMIDELRNQSAVSDREAADILSFCSTSGPLFVLGAVGSAMLGSERAGYIILFSHYIGAILTGMVLNENSLLNRNLSNGIHRKRRTDREKKNLQRENNASVGDESFTDMLTGAVLGSFRTIVIIGGYVIIFSVITRYISACSQIMLPETVQMPIECVSGLLEITVGCRNISMLADMNIEMKTILCSFLVSFGGISVAGQTMSVLKNTKITFVQFMKIKLLHGLLACAVTVVILLRFKS